MTANVMTALEGRPAERTIQGKPFKHKWLWFFVHKTEYGNYIITEWSTGQAFTATRNKALIKAALGVIFNKYGRETIDGQIKKAIEKYGVANEAIKEDCKDSSSWRVGGI